MTTNTSKSLLKSGKIKLIGLTGKKNSGKDTAAEPLMNKGWAKVSFAMPLKDICSKCFGIHPEFFENRRLKETEFEQELILNEKDVENLLQEFTIYSPHTVQRVTELLIGKKINTPRELLQFIGTDVVRNAINKKEWLDRAEKKILEWFEREECVVITDVRFPDEADLIRKLGGTVIKIDRTQENNEESTHESESLNFDADMILYNSGSIDSLQDQVNAIVEEK